MEKPGVNVIDAAARGAGDGLQLCAEHRRHADRFPGADRAGQWHPRQFSTYRSQTDSADVYFLAVAWLLGVKWNDCQAIGNLLGTRLVLNEFVAFQQLGPMRGHLDPRSFTIATYALCGFANFSSIAIQIGGIGALAPSRKSDLARLGLKAVAAGTMANFMSACIAGMLL